MNERASTVEHLNTEALSTVADDAPVTTLDALRRVVSSWPPS